MDLRTKLELAIQFLQKDHDELLDKVKAYCQNKDYPLSDRWDIFMLSNMGDEYAYIQRFHPLVNDYIDSDWLNRYEKIYVEDIIQWYYDEVYDRLSNEIMDSNDFSSEKKVEEETELELADLKEAALQQFIKSFRFDW